MFFTVRITAKDFIRPFFIMFHNHNTSTVWAFLIDRLIPQDEIAVWIMAATVEDTAPFRFPFNQRSFAAFRTRNA